MASVKEITEIIEMTPATQPIMLEGMHGIGKSEVVKEYFEAKGYRVQILFLGQMSDAGDVLGLPERKKIMVDGIETTVTDFCPPAWWSFDKDEKLILFLDELNRAKPEIHQVIMDLVLNRKLYNRKLPDNCRIVSAVNPLDDGYYQVEELDPALLDRFNKYLFQPTVDEWIDWGTRKKVHNFVLGFVSRHNDHLDPPNSKEYRPGKVYPSRRSWKKVSDLLTETPLLNDIELLKTTMLGIVGERSVSAFGKYLKEVNTGIHAGSLLTNYSADLEAKLLTMNTQDFVHLNREICFWFETKDSEKMLSDNNKKNASKWTYNLERYLNVIPREVMAEFFTLMSEANVNKKSWAKKVMSLNPPVAHKMIETLNGDDDDEQDQELKDNLSN